MGRANDNGNQMKNTERMSIIAEIDGIIRNQQQKERNIK